MDGQLLRLPVESVPSAALKERNENDFVNKQLAMRMFDCLDGADFERNLLLVGGDTTPYGGVKTAGRAGPRGETSAYASNALAAMGRKTAWKLLHLCRLCSYLGGPGFPDLIVLGHEWGLRYTSMDLQQEQQLFCLLAREAGMTNIGILKIVPRGSSEKPFLDIDIRRLLTSTVSSRRFLHYGDRLASLVEQEKAKATGLTDPLQLRQCRDEITFLQQQSREMPFTLLRQWAEQGVDREQLFQAMAAADAGRQQRHREEQAALESLAHDEAFASLGRGRDEATLRAKLAYLQQRFSIGPSRAGEILKKVW